MKIRFKKSSGYALISTLLVLALVMALAVALLSMLQKDTKRTGQERYLTEARANARYGLDLALSQLQTYAGPDQAVSATAEILEVSSGSPAPVPNPKWTGIWSTTETARQNQSPGAFLVSGNEKFKIDETLTEYPEGYLNPMTALDEESDDVMRLVSPPDDSVPDQGGVLVQTQPLIETATGEKKGHYGYWVGDEGVKAKVTLLDPFRDSTQDEEKTHRFTVAQRNGIEAILPEFDAGDSRLGDAVTMSEVGLVEDKVNQEEMGRFFHDLTTHSRGLLTNTRDGGLRHDLTLAFENDKLFEKLFAAKKTGITSGSSLNINDLYTLDTARLNEYYLIPDILTTAKKTDSNLGRWLGGPNWSNLREYYLLSKLSTNNIPFLPHPRCGVKMRHYSFNPYKHGSRNDKRDYYQRNSPICPVLSRAQMSIRLRTKEIPSKPPAPTKYTIELEVQPVIGIWNPYDIEFTSRVYRFDWEISIFLDLKIDGVTKTYDLYRLWNSSSPWFSFNTEPITLQPGEFRLLTIDTRKSLAQTVTLVPRWSEDGAFWVRLPVDPTNKDKTPVVVEKGQTIEIERVGLVAAEENQNWSAGLKDLQKHNTFMAIKYGEDINSSSSAVENSSIRMNNLWKADDMAGPAIVPEPDDAIPPFRPEQHTEDPMQLATWAYHMRTSQEDVLGNRNFIDSNVRAIVASSRWDGSVKDRGWRAVGWLNDGANRALLPPGNEEPEADGIERYRGFGGNAIGANGQTHITIFDVPREPLVSLGQLQHANIGRYNNEPSFVVGNSYQNIRIPLDQVVVRDFAKHDTGGLYNSAGLDVYDLSYLVNEKLWDGWFFSTIDPGNTETQIADVKSGAHSLPNSRILINDPENELVDQIQNSPTNLESYNALGAKFSLDGAFNINSTSVNAWKAVLSSLRDVAIPVFDPKTMDSKWTTGKIVFSRLSRPFADGFNPDDSKTRDNYWRGFRELTGEQIDSIATEMVRQVKLRGPFRSLADFVNRSLVDQDPSPVGADDTRLSGALQAALDRSVGGNAGLPSEVSTAVDPVPDSASEFHDVPSAGIQGTGFPGFLLQGDLLQPLGPILSARSDTFRIRAYGDSIVIPRGAPDTEILKARAWCEAIVQRLSEPVEPLSKSSTKEQDLMQSPLDVDTLYHSQNKPYFGRKFRIVSFRWLDKDEL